MIEGLQCGGQLEVHQPLAAKDSQGHALSGPQVVQNAGARRASLTFDADVRVGPRVDLPSVNSDQFVARVDAAFISGQSGDDTGDDGAFSSGLSANAERAGLI